MNFGKLFSSVVAIARFENHYIDEWIAYHLLIGFDHIFLYDNSEPGEESLSHVSEKFYQKVTVIKMPGRYMQGIAYTHFVDNFSANVEWAAFLDIDEFLIFKQDITIQNFINKYGHLDSIAVSWLGFGHSGHKVRPQGLVLDNYVWRFPVYLSEVKTLCKCSSIERIVSVHNINGNAKLIDGTSLNGGGILHRGHEIKYSKALDFTDIVCINHYFTRSLEDIEIKAARGSAAGTVIGRRDFSWYFNFADAFNWKLDLTAPRLLRELVACCSDSVGNFFKHEMALSDNWSITPPIDFDAKWYKNFYPDLKGKSLLPVDLMEHFCTIGAFEGRLWSEARWEGCFFDEAAYFENNVDLTESGFSIEHAHYHYLVEGQRAGRPVFGRRKQN